MWGNETYVIWKKFINIEGWRVEREYELPIYLSSVPPSFCVSTILFSRLRPFLFRIPIQELPQLPSILHSVGLALAPLCEVFLDFLQVNKFTWPVRSLWYDVYSVSLKKKSRTFEKCKTFQFQRKEHEKGEQSWEELANCLTDMQKHFGSSRTQIRTFIFEL